MGVSPRENGHVLRERPRGFARAALAVIGTVAGLVGLLQLIGPALAVFGGRAVGPVEIDGLTLANAEVVSFADRMKGATGRYESVRVEVADPPRALLDAIAWHDAAASLPVILICAVLCWLSWSALRGRPFARLAPWLLGLTGLALLVLDVLIEWLHFRVGLAVVQAVGVQATGGDTGAGAYEGLSTGAAYTPDHLGLALFLIVLAVVFALGLRMQRDTEALV